MAIRQSALLVSIDRHLVTTEEVTATGATFDVVRGIVIVGLVLIGLLAIRWLAAALPVFADLRRRGVIDGPEPGGGLGRFGLMWRAAGVHVEQATWSDLRVAGRPGRARLAALAVLIAAIIGVVATVGLAGATDAQASRALRIVAGLDGVLWLIATVLAGGAIDDILWREAAAARAVGMFIPLVDAPGRVLFRLVPPALLFVAGAAIASGRPDPWFVPCPSAILACDGMLVPAAHGGGSNATIWVVYAIHRAEGAPLGTLAIAVGGPGASGIEEAIPIIDMLDPELVRRYDLLFWDPRGVGASEGRDCPRAGFTYATAKPDADSARAFAEACLKEAEVDPADVARYATSEAAEDLESIRDHLGLARFALYGESYGTELAQTYAAAHPDRLTALILDGAVDLTESANAFWRDAARSFDAVLTATLESCSSDRDCHRDVADPVAAYDEVLRRFASPSSVSFADADGTIRDHAIDAAAIEAAVDALLYEPAGRLQIQRAVAAASQGDDAPLARLVDLLGSGNGPAASSFAYHAVTCADYRVSPTSDPADLAAVIAYAEQAGIGRLRTDEVFGTQLPCLFWPYQPASSRRPAPLAAAPYPVFVLGATDDPITPVEQARAIASRLDDGYLIVTDGGPHVTFGRGNACVDGPVVRFLLVARLPASRSLSCPGVVADPYVALTPTRQAAYRDGLDAMIAAETEVFADPDYRFWDGARELRVGCRDGGFFVVSPATIRDNLRFADCAFVDGLPLTGVGTYEHQSGDVSWTVTFPDGQLEYHSSSAGRSATGTYRGKPVDLSH